MKAVIFASILSLSLPAALAGALVKRCDAGTGAVDLPNGTFLCGRCLVGYYAPATTGKVYCTKCPSDRPYTNAEGKTSINDCLKDQPVVNNGCKAGQGMSTDRAVIGCVTCPANTYSAGGTNAQCQTCPTASDTRGATGVTSSAGCQLCDPGTFQGSYGSSCRKCPGSTYQDQKGQTQCPLCPDGYVSNGMGASECSACGFGTYSSAAIQNLNTCTNCAAGYSSGWAPSTCYKCSAGTVAPVGGPGKFCQQCPKGSFSDSTNTVCYACDYGYYGGGYGTSGCTKCPNGLTTKAYGAKTVADCVKK